MPRKPKSEKPGAEVLAPIRADVLDQIVRDGPLSAAEVETATRRFKEALIERALGAELTHHLGYRPGASKPELATNHRNGTSGKTVLTDDGPVPIEVPRDRAGTFYARGLTVREIQAFLKEMYAVDVSPELISTVTDAVVAEVTAWQSRPLEPLYPVVFFDALRVKIRDEAVVRSKAVYLALAVLPDGSRDILGIWIKQTEGAQCWMKAFTDLKTRGCQDGRRLARGHESIQHSLRRSLSPRPVVECARRHSMVRRATEPVDHASYTKFLTLPDGLYPFAPFAPLAPLAPILAATDTHAGVAPTPGGVSRRTPDGFAGMPSPERPAWRSPRAGA